jgi:hypothetical protein
MIGRGCEAEVSKKFLIHFSNVKTGLFKPCTVCDDKSPDEDARETVQIEPTFSDQTIPGRRIFELGLLKDARALLTLALFQTTVLTTPTTM